MSILVNADTRVICQGITGAFGAQHTRGCLFYGTKMAGGVTPGKGGTRDANGLPIFDTVEKAVAETGASATMIFVPPGLAGDAILEAAYAGIRVICCITEGVPVQDMIRVRAVLDELQREREVTLIGPNCPGIITPNQCRIGIMPGYIHKPGNIGVVSRSGTLTYEAVHQLTTLGLGQTTAIGIGGDPVNGTNFVDVLELFNEDPDCHGIVMIGEIGGSAEEAGAAFIKDHVKKPVVGFIAGTSAPPGKRMGHAGAIISGGKGTAEAKFDALRAAGVKIAETPSDIGAAMASMLG
jgi:succinyl-CoA synthetase alpha subunit